MPLRRETHGPVTILTLDRPQAMNAIDPETNAELIQEWTRFRDDREQRVAILTGAGEKAFCAGVDLKRIDEWYAKTPKELRREVWNREPGLGGITRNLDVGKPVIAAINGHCLGGGLELALACDLRIASQNATFALPETKWGILPGQGGTQRLTRLIPRGVAMEMILLAKSITAQRAYEVGLVNHVVPSSELLREARAWAETIASRTPRTIRHAREAVLRGPELPLEEGLRLEQALADPLRDGEEGRTARSTFQEKPAKPGPSVSV